MTADRDGRTPLIEELTEHDLARARVRLEHVLEVETGFRSGSRHWARPGEPRPAFDPTTTSLGERRLAKVAELSTLSGIEAARLGLESVSERTLKRMAARYREAGLIGLADGRWTRQAGGHPSVTTEVEEAIRAVHEQCLRRSRISMAVHQYVREAFPDQEVRVPRGAGTAPHDAGAGVAGVVRARRRPPAICALGGRGPGAGRAAGDRVAAGAGSGAGFDAVAGEGPRRCLRHPDHGAPDDRAGRVHALDRRVPADAGRGVVDRGGDAAAGRPLTAAHAPWLGRGHGLALPRGARGVGGGPGRRASGRAAVLHPGGHHRRPRNRLQKPPPGGGRPHARGGRAAGAGDAAHGQGRVRTGLRRDPIAAAGARAGLAWDRRRRPWHGPGG